MQQPVEGRPTQLDFFLQFDHAHRRLVDRKRPQNLNRAINGTEAVFHGVSAFLDRYAPVIDRFGTRGSRYSDELHRVLTGSDSVRHVMDEAMIIRDFRRHARSLIRSSDLVQFRSILDSIPLMQHYGAPTRLLDPASG